MPRLTDAERQERINAIKKHLPNRGGAVGNGRIDIAYESRSGALRFGVRNLRVLEVEE